MSTVYTHTAVRQIGVAWRDEGCVCVWGGGGGEMRKSSIFMLVDG